MWESHRYGLIVVLAQHDFSTSLSCVTIDGFLSCLGLIVAIYALASPIARYRLRLQGILLWLPSVAVLFSVVYLLLFDSLGVVCDSGWCTSFILHDKAWFGPNQLAFLLFLGWLLFVAALSTRHAIGRRQLTVLGQLLSRFELEKRYGELVDFVEPHIELLMLAAERKLGRQVLIDRVRRHGEPISWLEELGAPRAPAGEPRARWTSALESAGLTALRPLVSLLPKIDKEERAAQHILRILYTSPGVLEYLALERPIVAIKMMRRRSGYDHDFSDKIFGLMIRDRRSQLNREILLNQVSQRFIIIDPQNEIINELFENAHVAEDLEVYRPIGNYPLELLEDDIGGYRNTISASKPRKDEIVWNDPTYLMIRFFDIMINSSMRDGIRWHMWLFYFNLTVDKLLRHMDTDNAEYDRQAEFPNFACYLIYEIFRTYGSWLDLTRYCEVTSPAVALQSTEPDYHGGSILKSIILSIGQSLGHVLECEKLDEEFGAYILDVVLRDYRDARGLPNGDKIREALLKSIISRGAYGKKAAYGEKLRECYELADHVVTFETLEIADAIEANYP